MAGKTIRAIGKLVSGLETCIQGWMTVDAGRGVELLVISGMTIFACGPRMGSKRNPKLFMGESEAGFGRRCGFSVMIRVAVQAINRRIAASENPMK